MKEDLLHYFWRTKKWGQFNLKTTGGEPIEVIYQGDYNRDQGPDFNYAKVKIGSTLWTGKIEMHVNATDWLNHNHVDDPQYKNVILHVVWNYDAEILVGGIALTTLELKNYISLEEIKRYQDLIINSDSVPCGRHLLNVNKAVIVSELEDSSVQRLQSKILRLEEELNSCQFDWDEILFRLFTRYLIGPVNAEASSMLTRGISIKQLHKISDNVHSIEAFLLGTAGLLDENTKDEYEIELYSQYLHFQEKYKLITLHKEFWYYSRLRPASFPNFRLAQLASLIHKDCLHLDSILEIENVKDIYQIYHKEVSEYWTTHYRFCEKNHAKIFGYIGRSSIDVIIINALVPLLYLYGKHTCQDKFCDRALNWLEQLQPEKNKFTKIFSQHGLTFENARLSQACIELFNNKCQNKKCLNCKIGFSILNVK